MMTVKHVDVDGHERLFQVESVERTTEGELVFGIVRKITSGRAFVMNEAGQTVAMYDFSKPTTQK